MSTTVLVPLPNGACIKSLINESVHSFSYNGNEMRFAFCKSVKTISRLNRLTIENYSHLFLVPETFFVEMATTGACSICPFVQYLNETLVNR